MKYAALDIGKVSSKLDKKSKVIQSAIINSGVDILIDQNVANTEFNSFNIHIETGKATNQKQTGRCWIFSGLNLVRHKMSGKLHCKNFELSQSYLMFYDKLEKANYFLENIIETRKLPTTSRLVSFLLQNPVQDGGQWDMFVNLVEKYGVVPKSVMNETYHSSNSATMNKLITLKLRQCAKKLRSTTKDLHKLKICMLREIYTILINFLGEPPKEFDWHYRDDKNKLRVHKNIDPKKFFKLSGFNCDDYISVVNAPTNDKKFEQNYCLSYINNVWEGRRVHYLNLPIDSMKHLALKQLQSGETVWFGADVHHHMDKKSGYMKKDLFLYEDAFDIKLNVSKGDGLVYGENKLNHAMLLTGAQLENSQVLRWKVENSWGDDSAFDGYYVMTDDWFNRYVYQVVIKKKYLSKSCRNVLAGKPVVLDPWDPLGTLALMK